MRHLVWALLLLSGCTSVYDLGGGRYMVPRQVEVRSPFGTNVGYAKLEACDAVTREARWSEPFAASNDYVNCYGVTEWELVSSQGQGGQIVSGALNAGALVGVGALLPSSASSATQSQSIVAPAPRGHH